MIILTIPLKTIAGFLCFYNVGWDSFYILPFFFILLSGIISFVISKSLHCLYAKDTDLNLREFFIIITISMSFTTFFLLLGHNILSYLLNLEFVYYVFKNILFCEARLGYPWFLNILPGGSSGSTGGQGSSNNPFGSPQGPEGDFIPPIDPNSTRSRRRSSCSENSCYNDNEDSFGYIKKCHRGFIKTCELRVNEKTSEHPELARAYGIDANIAANTGIPFLDFTRHQLRSGMLHLNQQVGYDYVIFKPAGDPEIINGFTLTARAKVEKEGNVLILIDNKYTGLTNRNIKKQVINVFKDKHL